MIHSSKFPNRGENVIFPPIPEIQVCVCICRSQSHGREENVHSGRPISGIGQMRSPGMGCDNGPIGPISRPIRIFWSDRTTNMPQCGVVGPMGPMSRPIKFLVRWVRPPNQSRASRSLRPQQPPVQSLLSFHLFSEISRFLRCPTQTPICHGISLASPNTARSGVQWAQ